MDVAQSPPLCGRLGEPLGLGERWSLTLAAPAGPSRPLLLFLPALPFTRQKLQLGSGLLFLPPTLNLSVRLLCYPCIKFPDSEPVTSGEKTSESQCPHQERMLSGMPFLAFPCPPSLKQKAHKPSFSLVLLNPGEVPGLAPLHACIHSSIRYL